MTTTPIAVRRLAAATAAVVVALTFTAASVAQARPADSGVPGPARASGVTTLAVIGDTPYGDAQVLAFPTLVTAVNADDKVGAVLHLGDIKNGSSTCTDERFAALRDLYDTFADPFVYTPGDNEWTDCHRPAAGGYLPTERLARVREVFFPAPGRTTIGDGTLHVASQDALVENSLWQRSQTIFSTVHVVGSNNDLAPWFGAAESPAQRATRLAEFDARQAADLDWIDRTFDAAEQDRAAGVVVAMQADTFAGGDQTGFTAVVRRLADRARAFGRPVLLLQGDTHRYLADRPLAQGSAAYGIADGVPNLRRVVVEGETAGEWLRLSVDPKTAEVFRWQRMPVGG